MILLHVFFPGTGRHARREVIGLEEREIYRLTAEIYEAAERGPRLPHMRLLSRLTSMRDTVVPGSDLLIVTGVHGRSQQGILHCTTFGPSVPQVLSSSRVSGFEDPRRFGREELRCHSTSCRCPPPGPVAREESWEQGDSAFAVTSMQDE